MSIDGADDNMAHFRKLPSGSWKAVIYVGTSNGKKIYEYITKATRQECKAAATALEAEIAEGKYKASVNITLGEAMDRYNNLVEQVISPTTMRSYEMYARNSFKELRDKPIKKLDSEDIQLHYATNRKHLNPKTIKNEHAYLSLVLKKYLNLRNPCKEVVLPKPVKYLYKTLSNAQIEVLLNNIQGHIIEVPILLGVWCGLREGEIAGLRWQDVDFENEYISVVQTFVRGTDGYTSKPPKSFAGTRQFYVHKYILEKIKKIKPLANSDRIFSENGNQIYQLFKRFLKINNLPDIRFHDLRHICATAMYVTGVPDLFASEVLGHSDPRMTKKYQHMRPEDQIHPRAVLDNFFLSRLKKTNNRLPKDCPS